MLIKRFLYTCLLLCLVQVGMAQRPAQDTAKPEGKLLEITPENIHDLPDDLLGATMTGYFDKFTKETEVPKEPPTPSTTT